MSLVMHALLMCHEPCGIAEARSSFRPQLAEIVTAVTRVAVDEALNRSPQPGRLGYVELVANPASDRMVEFGGCARGASHARLA
jgi:hypothetical protein